MLRHWRLGVCALGLAALAISPAISAPDDDLSGDWKLDGQNGAGHYTGTAHVDRGATPDDWVADLVLSYDSGDHGTAHFTGTLHGSSLKGKRLRTTGIINVLDGTKKKPVNETWTLSADGLSLTGTYAGFHESLKRDKKPDAAKATLKADPQITLVPNAPATFKGAAHVVVTEGTVKLVASPADVVKVDSSDLDVGSHDLVVEPVKEGSVELQLLSGSTVVDHVKVTVVKEQLYLVIFAYMGTEVTFLDSDMAKAKSHVIPKLQAAGYTIIEDGKSYNQGTIDKGLADPKNPKKAVVDWCLTSEDFDKYFARGSVKGYIWSSHGFMEPYPGCPDSELKQFESREWTAAPGDPSQTGDKHFVREWKSKFEKNGTMDFGLNHACCTGGIGDYASEAWEYCDSATKDRVQQLFGKLPEVSELGFTTHDSLKGHFKFQQNFNGSAYFGMTDVKWDELEASIKP